MKRYETLDALRGVAALAVLIFHLSAFGLGANLAPHAYLAVDFFFVLSGFVIAHAYGEALASSLSWFDFARRRVFRLFPLALFGAVFGLAVLLLKWKLFPGREGALGDIVTSGVLNLFLLPSFFSGPIYDNAIFPGDGPLWSLFFELAINLAWAGIAARWGSRRLVLLVVASGACLTALAVGHGSTRMGVEPQSFWGGAARAAFGFTLGVLIHGWLGRFNGRAWRGGALVATAALGFAFCAPTILVHSRVQALIWDLSWILVGLPVIVIFGASQRAPRRLARLLGDLSYPLYVLHWPCLAIMSGLRQKVFRGIDPIVFYAAAVLGIIAVSWLVLKVYDEPLRRWLAGLARGPRPGDAGQIPKGP